jgi:hypothetical protein
MTKPMTNGMTKPTAPVERLRGGGYGSALNFARQFSKALRPLSLTILSLIQIALLPALVMGPLRAFPARSIKFPVIPKKFPVMAAKIPCSVA